MYKVRALLDWKFSVMFIKIHQKKFFQVWKSDLSHEFYIWEDLLQLDTKNVCFFHNVLILLLEVNQCCQLCLLVEIYQSCNFLGHDIHKAKFSKFCNVFQNYNFCQKIVKVGNTDSKLLKNAQVRLLALHWKINDTISLLLLLLFWESYLFEKN